MDHGARIITRYNNQNLQLIFSETILLYSIDTDVTIFLPEINWNFRLVFIRNSSLENFSARTTITGNTIEIVYNSWLGNEVQNTSLQNVNSENGVLQIYYALKTSANIIDNRRSVTFTVWQGIT